MRILLTQQANVAVYLFTESIISGGVITDKPEDLQDYQEIELILCDMPVSAQELKHCTSIISYPLDLPPELKGKQLSLDQVKKYIGPPQHFSL